MNKVLKAFRKICRNLNSYEFTDEYKKNNKLIETALKELEDYKTKPRKKGFGKQDNRLRLAYQEMGKYSNREEVPQELRGKPYGDIIGIVPKDEKGRWDLYLMFSLLLNRPIHDREWDKDKKCFIEYPCLLQELENRGYDVKTFYFEIAKRNKRKTHAPYKNYLHFRENLDFDSKTEQKKLKALEIIKETLPIKEEDFFYDKETDTYFFIGYKVSKEQFDLLKEVLL